MAHYPTEFAQELQILTPDMDLGDRACAALESLQARGFVATVGLLASQAEVIREQAREPGIAEYCAGDQRRFTAEWMTKEGGRGMVVINAAQNEYGQQLDSINVANMPQGVDLRPVADGWSGKQEKPHVPGVDITTAYRVSHEGQELARQRRTSPEDRFSLGRPLGELVIATGIKLFGADPRAVGLDVWKSNPRAIRMYEEGLDFERVAESSPTNRPTLLPVGTNVNGNVVRETIKDGKLVREVEDTRYYYRLSSRHPLGLAA